MSILEKSKCVIHEVSVMVKEVLGYLGFFGLLLTVLGVENGLVGRFSNF